MTLRGRIVLYLVVLHLFMGAVAFFLLRENRLFIPFRARYAEDRLAAARADSAIASSVTANLKTALVRRGMIASRKTLSF